MGKFKFGSKSINILDTVNRYLQLCAKETIKKSAIDISIPEWGGFRTAEYQNELYEKKWSKADGFNKKSRHQIKDSKGKSVALDLCAYVNGELSWEKERLIYIATLFRCTWDNLKANDDIPKYFYVHSGMLWSNKDAEMGWDRPHMEVHDYAQLPNIKS